MVLILFEGWVKVGVVDWDESDWIRCLGGGREME